MSDRSRPRAPAERRPRWARRLIASALVIVVFIGVLFVAVFPTQTYLSQQDEAEVLRRQLAEVEARNVELRAHLEHLEDPAQVELLARRDFGLVKPGEEAYSIVPAEGAATDAPTWPFQPPVGVPADESPAAPAAAPGEP